jgi:DNA-binding transcriptional ArsR family regulator
MRPPQQNDVFHAIAHPARRAILLLLKDADQTAGGIAEPFRMSFPAISQHLNVLKAVNLLTERREGRQRIYSLRPQPLAPVASWIHEFERSFSRKLDALEAHLDRKHGRKRRAPTSPRRARFASTSRSGGRKDR